MFPCNLPGTNFPETWPCVHHNWSFIWKMMSQPWDGMVFPSSRQPPCLVNAVSIFIPCFLHWNCHVYCHGERRPPGTIRNQPHWKWTSCQGRVQRQVFINAGNDLQTGPVSRAISYTPWCCTYDGRGWYSWLMHPLTNTIRTKQIRVRSDRYSWMQHFSSLKFLLTLCSSNWWNSSMTEPTASPSFVRSSFSTAAFNFSTSALLFAPLRYGKPQSQTCQCSKPTTTYCLTYSRLLAGFSVWVDFRAERTKSSWSGRCWTVTVRCGLCQCHRSPRNCGSGFTWFSPSWWQNLPHLPPPWPRPASSPMSGRPWAWCPQRIWSHPPSTQHRRTSPLAPWGGHWKTLERYTERHREKTTAGSCTGIKQLTSAQKGGTCMFKSLMINIDKPLMNHWI